MIDPTTTSDATLALLITSICGLIIGVLNAVLSFMREGRNHRWAVDESERAEHRTKGLATKIDQNTDISVKAFDVANNVNEKIAAIGGLRLTGAAADRQTDHIQQVVEETHDDVREIKDVIKKEL